MPVPKELKEIIKRGFRKPSIKFIKKASVITFGTLLIGCLFEKTYERAYLPQITEIEGKKLLSERKDSHEERW